MQPQYLAVLLLSVASVGRGFPHLEARLPAALPDPETLSLADKSAIISDDVICGNCMKFFSHLQHSLSSKTLCMIAVLVLGPALFKAFQSLDNETFCRAIHMCPGSPEPLIPYLDQKSPDLFGFGGSALKAASGLPITECHECLSFMKGLNAFTSDKAMTVVYMVVDYVCPHVAMGLRDQCISVLHTLLPKMIGTVINIYFHPPQICHYIHMCSKDDDSVISADHQVDSGNVTLAMHLDGNGTSAHLDGNGTSAHLDGNGTSTGKHNSNPPSDSTTPRPHMRESETTERQPTGQTTVSGPLSFDAILDEGK